MNNFLFIAAMTLASCSLDSKSYDLGPENDPDIEITMHDTVEWRRNGYKGSIKSCEFPATVLEVDLHRNRIKVAPSWASEFWLIISESPRPRPSISVGQRVLVMGYKVKEFPSGTLVWNYSLWGF
ncbi:MAG: hypothetical protein R3B55_02490 [Candidatus Paceibacterota bacterium]